MWHSTLGQGTFFSLFPLLGLFFYQLSRFSLFILLALLQSHKVLQYLVWLAIRKNEVFLRGILGFIHQSHHQKFHSLYLNFNYQRLSPTFQGNQNTINGGATWLSFSPILFLGKGTGIYRLHAA